MSTHLKALSSGTALTVCIWSDMILRLGLKKTSTKCEAHYPNEQTSGHGRVQAGCGVNERLYVHVL